MYEMICKIFNPNGQIIDLRDIVPNIIVVNNWEEAHQILKENGILNYLLTLNPLKLKEI
jgi:hypothetical protein